MEPMRDNGASSPYYRIWSYIAYLSCCCLILIPVAALIFLVDPKNARSLGSSGLIFLFVLMVTGSFCLAAGTVRCLACRALRSHIPTSGVNMCSVVFGLSNVGMLPMRDIGASSPCFCICSYVFYLACCCLYLYPVGVLIYVICLPFLGKSLEIWVMIIVSVLFLSAAGLFWCVAICVLGTDRHGERLTDRHNEADARLDAVVFAAHQSNVRMAQPAAGSSSEILRSAIARSAEASDAAEAAASLAAGGSSSEIGGGVGVIADWRPAH